jgi:hypothetical protein
MKKLKLLQIFALAVGLMLTTGNVWGQYSGTGTFTKITSIGDLTDGYYVITNESDQFAMNNTNAGSFFQHTSISPSSNQLTDPAGTIVWKIETNEGGKTIFNEASSKYVSYTGSSNAAYAVDNVTSDNQRWSFDYSSDKFFVNNLAITSRQLSYNSGAPRFACYGNSGQQELQLYKMEEATNDPLINVNPTSLTGFTYVFQNGPSAEQEFTISGENLTANISIAATTNYEISTGTGGSFVATNPITLPETGGTVAETTIYVRLKAGLDAGTYNDEDITATSTDADNKTVTCSGSVSDPNLNVEDFANYPETGTAYNTGTFLGQDGSTWNYIKCAGSSAGHIDAPSPLLGRNQTPSAEIYSGTINGGIGTLSFEYMQAFSTNVDLNVYINGSLVGNVTSSSQQSVVLNSGDIVINVVGDFVLKFAQNGSGGQVSIDNVSWTSYSTGNEPPSITNITQDPASGITSSTTVSVSADVTDSDGTVEGVELKWGTSTGTYPNSIDMSLSTKGTYVTDTDIPTQTDGTTVFYVVYALDNDSGETTSPEQSYTVTDPVTEPTNHPTAFTAESSSSSAIMVIWTDAVPAADGYLIKGSTTSYAAIVDPVDGTPETDALLVQNIAAGVEIHEFTGLSASTQYFFKIYPYNGSGATINYKTDGTVPTANAITESISLGLQIDSIDTEHIIDFDNTVDGVNNGQFDGTGFHPTPFEGKLNSNAWAVTGWSDGDLNFGGTQTTGDFARGTSTGGVTTGGIYAFEVETGNRTLGFQPGTSDWAPGTVILRIQNKTGTEVTGFHISYIVYIRNDHGRSNSFNFSHSSDNDTYTDVSDLNLTSTEIADGSPSWKSYKRIAKITGLNLADEGHYYLKWTGDDVGGGGSRDEFALDDITVVANPTGALPISGTFEEVVLATGTETEIASDASLTVNSALTNNAGTSGLVIKSGGSLLHNTAGVSGTMERNITGYTPPTKSATVWSFLSSPVNNFAISGSSFEPGADDDFYAWDETPPGTWLNYKVSENGITNFVNGHGYLVAYEGDLAGVFTGTFNTDDITVTLKASEETKSWSYTAGWNLLGNPYPSAIDWSVVGAHTSTFEDVFAYVYNADRIVEELPSPGYEAIDGSLPNAFIAANQGFFVQALPASNNVDFIFTNSMRGHGGTFMKESSLESKIVLTIKNSGYADKTTIRLRNGSSFGRDGLDALKMFSFDTQVPQIYTLTTDQRGVAINSIPSVDESLVIPIGLLVPADGMMTITLDEFTGEFDDLFVLLFDQKTGITHKFVNSLDGYTFNASTDDTDRFLLKFETVSVHELPTDAALHIYGHGSTVYLNSSQNLDARIAVYNITGQQVYGSRLMLDGLKQINLNLPTGWYVVSVTSDKAMTTQKVFIR